MTSLLLRLMTEDRFHTYRQHLTWGYAEGLARSGTLPLPEAQARAEAEVRRLLPAGTRTPGHHLWTAHDGDLEVGLLWIGIETRSDGPNAFIYDIEVREELRRRGYGGALLAAAERTCREMGVVALALTVFGYNQVARRLYETAGFEVTSLQLRKRL